MFARICRFDQTYRQKEKNPDLDFLSIAYQLGYYDYQHLAKDFKAFMGDSPSRIFQMDEGSLDRFLGLSQ